APSEKMRYRSMEATRSGDLRSDDGGVRRPSPNNVGRRRGQRPSPNNHGGVRRSSPNNRTTRTAGSGHPRRTTGHEDGGVRTPSPNNRTEDGGVRRPSPNNRDDERRRGQETLAEQPGHETAGSRDHAEQPEDSGVRRSSPNDSASRSYSSTVIR